MKNILSSFFHYPFIRKKTTFNASDFHNISIRGRVAFSIHCLNAAIRHFNMEELPWSFLLHKLWSFTTIQHLDDWHEATAEVIPSAVEHDEYTPDFRFTSKEEFDGLLNLYHQVNKGTKEIINLVFYIGTCELYGKVSRGGMSLEYMRSLFKIMNKNNIPLPDIGAFKKFSFEENNGWGKNFTQEEIVLIGP